MNEHLSWWAPAAIVLVAGSTNAHAGSTYPPAIEFASLDGSIGVVIQGIGAGSVNFIPLASAGDVNGDGIDDIILGSPFASPNGSTSKAGYVVFGAETFGSSGAIDISNLDGVDGFVLCASAGDYAGYSVSSAGDVNGDGFGDILIGAAFASPIGAGAAYVVFGGPDVGVDGSIDLTALDGFDGFAMNGVAPGDMTGYSVSGAGDVNGDGFDDVFVGARRANSPSPGSGVYPGGCYVVFGGETVGQSGSIECASLDGSNGFHLSDDDVATSFLGQTVAGAGDLNGDSLADLICGAASNTGVSYVVFGSSEQVKDGDLTLTSLANTIGFRFIGPASSSSGASVSPAGDVNGDGLCDVIVGAATADPNGQANAGESYVVYGTVSKGGHQDLAASALDGANGFVLAGVNPGDLSGASVSVAGDINSDGFEDLVVGAYAADPGGRSRAGEAYIVFGGQAAEAGGVIDLSGLDGANGFVCHGINPNDNAGISVSAAGDFNGDGVGDVIIGSRAPSSDGQPDSGEVYVVFGRCALAGDLNSDGAIDTADLGIVIDQYGTEGPGADINNDQIVDIADLGLLISAFGSRCH